MWLSLYWLLYLYFGGLESVIRWKCNQVWAGVYFCCHWNDTAGISIYTITIDTVDHIKPPNHFLFNYLFLPRMSIWIFIVQSHPLIKAALIYIESRKTINYSPIKSVKCIYSLSLIQTLNPEKGRSSVEQSIADTPLLNTRNDIRNRL